MRTRGANGTSHGAFLTVSAAALLLLRGLERFKRQTTQPLHEEQLSEWGLSTGETVRTVQQRSVQMQEA